MLPSKAVPLIFLVAKSLVAVEALPEKAPENVVAVNVPPPEILLPLIAILPNIFNPPAPIFDASVVEVALKLPNVGVVVETNLVPSKASKVLLANEVALVPPFAMPKVPVREVRAPSSCRNMHRWMRHRWPRAKWWKHWQKSAVQSSCWHWPD